MSTGEPTKRSVSAPTIIAKSSESIQTKSITHNVSKTLNLASTSADSDDSDEPHVTLIL